MRHILTQYYFSAAANVSSPLEVVNGRQSYAIATRRWATVPRHVMAAPQCQAVAIGGGEVGRCRIVPREFQQMETAAELSGVGEGRELAEQAGVGLPLHGE